MPAAETRVQILVTAGSVFSRAGFDQVGVRELAAAAAVDPAVVIRLFGSKEALFAAVAADAFALDAIFQEPVAQLGRLLARHLMGKPASADCPLGLDTFRFLLHSASSPVAAPILSASLHAGFIGPLAAHFGGEEAGIRAALLASCILGFATLRFGLTSPVLEGAAADRVEARLGAVLQACIDGG